MFGERGLESAVRAGTPPTSRDATPVPSPASSAISGVAAGSARRCGGAACIRSPRVMLTPMPIGSRSQEVAVGPMGRSIFRRRSQTGPVRFRTLSGNAVGGVTATRVRIPLAPPFRCSIRDFALRTERSTPRGNRAKRCPESQLNPNSSRHPVGKRR
jgi:hypothetical protein